MRVQVHVLCKQCRDDGIGALEMPHGLVIALICATQTLLDLNYIERVVLWRPNDLQMKTMEKTLVAQLLKLRKPCLIHVLNAVGTYFFDVEWNNKVL